MSAEPENMIDLASEIKKQLENDSIKKLTFEGKVFSDNETIKEIKFTKEVSFTGSKFLKGLSLNMCVFEEVSVFDVTFGGKRADFSDCTFKKLAVFRPREIQSLSLRSSEFFGGFEIAPPSDQSMEIDLRYSKISAIARLKALGYNQPDYQGQVKTGSIEIYEATIEKEAILEIAGVETDTLHLGDIFLQDKASIYINDVTPKNFYLNDLRVTDKANVSLYKVSLQQARFSGTNIERFVFSNVSWPKLNNRVCLFEEIELFDLLKSSAASAPESAENSDNRERVAENYRQLVLNYEAKRNYDLAEFFHIGEMELMRLKAAVALPPFLGKARLYLNAFWLYRLLSEYGTSYRRAALMLAVLLCVFSTLFLLNGIKFRETSNTVNYDIVFYKSAPRIKSVHEMLGDYSTSLAMTLSLATLQKERPVDPDGIDGIFLTSLMVVIVPGQAALLLFALRRKFRRASI